MLGVEMETTDFLDKLLLRYQGTFDIHKPITIGEKEYSAYGYFYSLTEKYVLAREMNLWSAESYEHIVFMEIPEITDIQLDEANTLLKKYIEPVLVRKESRYPAKNHMYSYMTVVMIGKMELSKEIIRKIKHYTYDKSYLFGVKGYSQGHLIGISIDARQVITNYAARKTQKLFQDVLKKTEEM